MFSLLLLGLPVATSLAAILIARRSNSDHRGLAGAGRLALELAGLSTLFLVANLALGLAIVLAIRALSSFFVSIYVLNDLSLVALSFLQGTVFFCWRRQPATRNEVGD